jgi:ankyrin repeat protein
VNFVNTKDGKRTPVMFAAAHGHLHCLQLLLESGAKASKEGYEVVTVSFERSRYWRILEAYITLRK